MSPRTCIYISLRGNNLLPRIRVALVLLLRGHNLLPRIKYLYILYEGTNCYLVSKAQIVTSYSNNSLRLSGSDVLLLQNNSSPRRQGPLRGKASASPPSMSEQGVAPPLICNHQGVVREMYLCWLCYLLIFHYDHILPDVVIE